MIMHREYKSNIIFDKNVSQIIITNLDIKQSSVIQNRLISQMNHINNSRLKCFLFIVSK